MARYKIQDTETTPFPPLLRGNKRGLFPLSKSVRLVYDHGQPRGEAKGGIMHRASCIMHHDNEKGIALVMTLVVSAIALAIMAGLIYMITAGTQISGIQKRYKTALEAGVGGAGVAYEYISRRGAASALYTFSPGVTEQCRTLKLNQRTNNWGACPANANSIAINPGDNTTYDWTFDLGTDPTYRVYAKIVDTIDGNSGGDEGLLKSGVVSSGTGEVTVVSMPYLYTIEIDAQNAANPAERAKLSILYQY